jgi:hypothetical protein
MEVACCASGVKVACWSPGVQVGVIEGAAAGASVSLGSKSVSLGAGEPACGVAVSLEKDGAVASAVCVSSGGVELARRVLVGTGEFTGAVVWVGGTEVEDGTDVGGG